MCVLGTRQQAGTTNPKVQGMDASSNVTKIYTTKLCRILQGRKEQLIQQPAY